MNVLKTIPGSRAFSDRRRNFTKIIKYRKFKTTHPHISKYRTCSFASDVLLHNLSYSDIFWLSVTKNLFLYQFPSVVIYRSMKCTLPQIVYYLLWNAIMKTIIDIYQIMN